MTTYKIRVNIPFTDAETGKMLNILDILETTSDSRVRSIINRGLGTLIEATHGKEGKRVLIHQSRCFKIGGIETANRQLARAFADRNIAFIFEDADQTQAMELAKTCDVIIDNGWQRYECDVLILTNYDSAPLIIKRVDAQKIYQFIHTDWDALKKLWSGFVWKPDSKIDKFVSVTETARDGLKKAFDLDSVVCRNVLAPLSKERRLVFLVLSRATQEKGIDRVIEFVDRLEAAGKDFVVFLCSTIEQLPKQTQDRIKASSRIILVEPSPYSQELIRSADYGLQLSRFEAYGFSIREFLQHQVPVIASKIPAFEEVVKDGENGYILNDDLSNLNIEKIFNEIPKFEPYTEEVDPTWYEILDGKI